MYLLHHIDYVFEKITLELSFDWRDGWIDLYVCRTVDGKPPPGWAYHEGRLVRIGLAEVLSRGETGDRAAGSQLIKAMRALNQADIPRRKRVERTRSWLLEHLLLLLAATLKETMPRVFALFDAVFDADRGQVSQGRRPASENAPVTPPSSYPPESSSLSTVEHWWQALRRGCRRGVPAPQRDATEARPTTAVRASAS